MSNLICVQHRLTNSRLTNTTTLSFLPRNVYMEYSFNIGVQRAYITFRNKIREVSFSYLKSNRRKRSLLSYVYCGFLKCPALWTRTTCHNSIQIFQKNRVCNFSKGGQMIAKSQLEDKLTTYFGLPLYSPEILFPNAGYQYLNTERTSDRANWSIAVSRRRVRNQ